MSVIVGVQLFVVKRPGINLNFLLVDPRLLDLREVLEILWIVEPIFTLLFVGFIDVRIENGLWHDIHSSRLVRVLHVFLTSINQHVAGVISIENL